MIKAKKGLLLSVFSLILALVITTSSTYAWFAMNSSVTASNMKISARADSSFLVIEKTLTGANGTKIGNISTNEIDLGVDGNNAPIAPVAVLPVTYKNTAGEGQAESWAWQTAVGTGYSNGAANSSGYTTISETDVISGRYAAKFTFYVGLNPNVAVNNATNLKVSSITVSDSGSGENASRLFPALSVLVRSSVGGVKQAEDLYLGTGTSLSSPIAGHDTENTVLASVINADGTPIVIDVFLFINGDNPVVTTEHTQATDLNTFTVGVAFTCQPPQYNATPANS